MAQQLVQAYKQAPWRIQLQKIGLFLLALVTVVLIASIYLDITTKAANAGVQIRILETDRVNIERKISDLNTQLAILNSSEVMEKRSIELGFVPATAEDIQYIEIDGFQGRSPALIAPPPGYQLNEQSLIKPAYKQSLWEWILNDSSSLIAETGK